MPKTLPVLEMMAELSNPLPPLPRIPYFEMPFLKKRYSESYAMLCAENVKANQTKEFM